MVSIMKGADPILHVPSASSLRAWREIREIVETLPP